ncbi:MAG: succinate dehydrogenase, hydrophobic membrane anchor protein [Nitrospirota bacterium]
MKGALPWFLHRVSGVLLFLGLALHFYVMHVALKENLGYEAVMARLRSPWWMAFDILFLAAALYHGFGGLWGMADEYIHEGRSRRAVKSILLGAAGGLGVVGLYVLTLA